MKQMGYTCKIDNSGRLKIPKRVMVLLRIKPGDEFEVYYDEDSVQLTFKLCDIFKKHDDE